MNFISALPWFGWLILAVIPPLILLLYFLRLKRQPLEVPSTYLWSKTIEDLHVNTIWQRLRKNLLLFLQLLLIALILLACLRPGMQSRERLQSRLIFLVDTSGSMSAKSEGGTRLDEAKKRIEALIDDMQSNDAAMIISFSDHANVVQSYTNNRNLLKRKLAALKPTNRITKLDEALRAAAGLANPPQSFEEGNPAALQLAQAMNATLYIFSDGGFETRPDFALGNLEPQYVPVGKSVDNVGLITFSTQENPEKPGEIQAFGQLQNSGTTDAKVDVDIYLDNKLLDAKKGLGVPAGKTLGLTFTVGQSAEQSVEAGVLKIQIVTPDALPIDNSAYAVFNTRKKSRVLFVTSGNPTIELTLKTEEMEKCLDLKVISPGDLEKDVYKVDAKSGLYDLVMFDNCQPKEMPLANTLFLGVLPPLPDWKRIGEPQVASIFDVSQAHPLTDSLQMRDILIAEAFGVEGPAGSLGLVDSNLGSLITVGNRQGFEDAVVSFNLYGKNESGQTIANTDWPRQPSFPMFFQNVIYYLGRAAGLNQSPAVLPGETVALRTAIPHQNVTVGTPSGNTVVVPRSLSNDYLFIDSDDLGVYDVREGESDQVNQRFAVNMLNARESNLQVPTEIDIGFEKVTGSDVWQPARYEFWRWIVLASLALLGLEWYIYNRRVYF